MATTSLLTTGHLWLAFTIREAIHLQLKYMFVISFTPQALQLFSLFSSPSAVVGHAANTLHCLYTCQDFHWTFTLTSEKISWHTSSSTYSVIHNILDWVCKYIIVMSIVFGVCIRSTFSTKDYIIITFWFEHLMCFVF